MAVLLMAGTTLYSTRSRGGQRDGRCRNLILYGQPVKGGARKGGSNNDDRASCYQRPRHESPHDLPLRPGKRNREPVTVARRRKRRRWEEGGGDGDDIESAMKGDGGARVGGRLAEGDVSYRAAPREDAEGDAAATGEAGNGVDDVHAAGNLEDVRLHGAFVGLTRYNNGGLGLVLGSRRPASWPAGHLNRRPLRPLTPFSFPFFLRFLNHPISSSSAASTLFLFRCLAFSALLLKLKLPFHSNTCLYLSVI